jgi:MFS family permease
MLITRKIKIPLHWIFYAQLPFVMAITASYATGAPFLFAMKKFIDNPAAITFLLSIEVFVTTLGGPFCNWLSDRIWTRFGRRKPFIVVSDILKSATLLFMPFAPDLMTLIILRWCYGIFADIGSPNQALTMEVVPTRQRGMGAGFFQLQIQIANLFFYGIILGRFDDIYFSGPFERLFSLSGEVLIFFAASLLMLSVGAFTWFGIHEVEPPNRKRITDDRRPGESLFKLFFRGFFGEILHKSLLPLYLLLMAGTLFGVGLGTLEPLLYTDQWGYSLQEMGTNVAIGATLGIFVSLLAGWIADKTSKFKVYATALTLTLLSRIVWTVFVYNKPNFRPELHEIILFGTVQSIFGMIAGAASFPLILEYVERNQLGTAGAGMGVFTSTIRNAFGMGVGLYLVMWSIWFLPQAGDRVDVVFRQELAETDVRSRLVSDGVDLPSIDLEPLHRPGTDGETSRHWKIRRPVEEAGDLHKKLKDLGNVIAKDQLKLQRPHLSPETETTLRAHIASLRDEEQSIRKRLKDSTAAFEALLTRSFGESLAPSGHDIVSARSSPDGTEVSLVMEFVEPVDADISKRTLFEALTFSPPSERRTVASELRRVLETVDLARVPVPGSRDYAPRLEVTPLSEPVNGMRIDLFRDPDFVAIESALTAAGIPWDNAYNVANSLLPPIRGLSSPDSASYAVSTPLARLDGERPTLVFLVFDLRFDDATVSLKAAELQTLLALLNQVVTARVTGAFPLFHVSLDLPTSAVKTVGEKPPSDRAARLRELLPESDEVRRTALAGIADRITQIATAGPTFLTAVRPVPRAQPADRQYDYFFSMQFFMIATDVLGLLLLGFIIRLEKRGVIKRVGAIEDANR